MLEDRRALPEEEGDLLREYQAMYEEDFLSCGGMWKEKKKQRKR